MSKRVLVTGATGFVGRPLCRALLDKGFDVFGAARRPEELDPAVVPRRIEAIGPKTDWIDALFTVDSIIHLAARVHVMEETAKNPLAAFRRVNTEGTLHLARQAADQGVRRFVYVSSIKVNGEATKGRAFNETDFPDPRDPYAVSKWEAEEGLWAIAKATGMEVVVVRPPLVYGPGVKGNFQSLLGLCARGVPFPLKTVANRRALISVGNLVDALVACLVHEKAPGQTFLVRDDEEVSTAVLVERISAAMGRKARLVGVPPKVLTLAGRMTGKTGVVDRLTGSLSIDDTHIRATLDWEPVETMEAALKKTVADFLRGRGKR